MYIKRLYLKNFKKFEELQVYFNKNSNLIIGENNIGKTTIFDALLLWKMAYDSLISYNGKDLLKKSNWNSMNITFTKLQMFRIVNARDLFLDHKKNAIVSLLISNETEDFELKIEMQIPGIEDSYIRFKNSSTLNEFKRFAEYAKKLNIKLKDMISISVTKPLFFISKHEIFYNKVIIEKYSYLGKNYEILRNKIIQTIENEKFDYLEDKLTNVTDKKFKIRFKNIRNKENSEYIKLTVKEEDKKEVDISLIGSGLLHLLEIFSSLYVKQKYKNALNVLLLDEPDSHIHSKLQSRLINELRNDTDRQVFIISHNDRIILKPNFDEIIYLIDEKIDNKNIFTSNKEEFFQIRNELADEFYKLEQEYWDDIDTTKHTIFVEGLSDKIILEKAFEYFAPEFLQDIKIEEGGGYNFVKNKILSWHYSGVAKKAIAIFDYDTLKAIEEISQQINQYKNTKILKLSDYKTKNLIEIFKHGIKIPFAIEELFDLNFCEYFNSQNWLTRKDNILDYNKHLLGIDKSFIQFLDEKNVGKNLRLYILNKVDKYKKEQASKYICNNGNKDDFKVLEKLVSDIKDFLYD